MIYSLSLSAEPKSSSLTEGAFKALLTEDGGICVAKMIGVAKKQDVQTERPVAVCKCNLFVESAYQNAHFSVRY